MPWLFRAKLRNLVACVAVLAGFAASRDSLAQAPDAKADRDARRALSGNLVGHGGPVKSIRVYGLRALTGSFDYSAILWDISGKQPKQVLRLADHGGAVNAVAFADFSRALTSGDEGKVALWSSGSRHHLPV